MRLLQAMAGAERGGAEAFFERLVPALGRAGVAQHAVIRRNPARARLLAAAGIGVDEVRFGGPLDLATALRFRAALARFRPDVVLTWMSRTSRACPRGPFVHVGRLGGAYDLGRFRRCHHLIVNARGVADHAMKGGWPASRIHLVANFAAEPAPVAALPRGAAPVALALGRLHPNKAFDVLIEAWTDVPGAELWLAGDGPLAAELRALAQRRGVASRVRFLGWRDDVAALYATADVVVCPSRVEPLGNVVLEAWAHRRPLVAAAAAGPAELVRTEEDGLLVPVDDAPALAVAVRRVLHEPRLAEGLAAAGRARYEAGFTEAAIVAAYRDLLASLRP